MAKKLPRLARLDTLTVGEVIHFRRAGLETNLCTVATEADRFYRENEYHYNVTGDQLEELGAVVVKEADQ